MAEPIDVDVAEVHSLRQEITNRIGLMNALVALDLAALGTGLTILNESTHVLAGLAVISSFLWLLWMDQSFCTYKIAAYLAVEMAPRLRELAGRSILGWETFLRHVEAGGRESVQVLYPGSPPTARGIVRGFRSDWYAPFLFGGASPLLLAFYAQATLHAGSGVTVTGLVCLIGALMWLFTVSRFVDFVHNTRVIDKAIVAAAARSEAEA